MVPLSACTRQLLRRFFLLAIFVAAATSCFSSTGSTNSNLNGREELELVSPSIPKTYRPRYTFWNQYTGALYLSGGYSAEFNYEGNLGGKVVLDYFVSEELSIGAQTSMYHSNSEEGSFNSNYLGIRISYHLLRAKLHRRQNPWNIYTGLSGELAIGPGEKDWHEKSFLADLHLGVRYRVGETWFLWGEAAINNASIGLSFVL